MSIKYYKVSFSVKVFVDRRSPEEKECFEPGWKSGGVMDDESSEDEPGK